MRGLLTANILPIVASVVFNMAAAYEKIDTHSHFLPDFYVEAMKEAGHIPGPDGMPFYPSWNIQDHLSFMANNSITKSILSISSPGVYGRVPTEDGSAAAEAAALARRINKYAAHLKAQYPDQIGYFASLPLPDITASLAEIRYLYEELDPKPDGIVLMSNAWGLYPSDEAMNPIYEALTKYSPLSSNGTYDSSSTKSTTLPIFIHPTTPCTSHNAAAVHLASTDQTPGKITPESWSLLNRPLAQTQRPTPMLDFLFDTTRLVAELLYRGHADTYRHSLSWIFAHAGAALPSTLDRIAAMSFLCGAPPPDFDENKIKEIFSTSFYFDMAGLTSPEWALPPLMSRWGVDETRITYGSDVPFTNFDKATELAGRYDEGLKVVFKGDEEKCLRASKGTAEGLF